LKIRAIRIISFRTDGEKNRNIRIISFRTDGEKNRNADRSPVSAEEQSALIYDITIWFFSIKL